MSFKRKSYGLYGLLKKKEKKSEYKETGALEQYRQELVERRSQCIDIDNGVDVEAPRELTKDDFVWKKVTVFNYSDEVKEVLEIDYTGFGLNGGRKGKKTNEVSCKDRERNLQRVKRNCRRLAFSNDLGQVHMVLTYKENMQDVDKSDIHFKNFIFKLRKNYPWIKYLATREFQTRGAVHYHVLLNSRVDIKVVQELWKHGFVTLVQHKNRLKAVMYVLKYISKEVGETVIQTANGFTKKAYLSSRGLKSELEACTSSFLINTPESYVEFTDGLNFMITNLTEGWDIPFTIDTSDRPINGRSLLRCAADNY